eukprot:2349035-Pleurochrysis_carterae.AAC.2
MSRPALGELASAQAAQPSRRPDDSEDGASDVSLGRERRRVSPTCNRWWRQTVASCGDMTST